MKDYTVCLMTCGEETEDECRAAINSSSYQYQYNVVRNITPAVVALNTMFAQCETDFLSPLDADMILYPDWCQRVYDNLALYRNRNDWHTILFPLWDTLTQEKIYAFKIFNMRAMRVIPYKDDPCPDIQHYKDLTDAGLRSIDLYDQEPIGDHVVRGRFFCYAKYRDLYMTARSRPRNILESHFKGGKTLREKARMHYDFFMDQHKKTNNDDYLYCIGGMLEGLTAPLTYKSKDLSQMNMLYQDSQSNRFMEWYRNDKSHRVFV